MNHTRALQHRAGDFLGMSFRRPLSKWKEGELRVNAINSLCRNREGKRTFQAQVRLCDFQLCFPIIAVVQHKVNIIVVTVVDFDIISRSAFRISFPVLALYTPFLFPELLLPVVALFPVQSQTKGPWDWWLGGLVFGSNAVVV